MNNKAFNTKYSTMQFCFFAAYAGLFAYAANYLLDLGFSSGTIGTILSLTSVLGVFVQPAVGSFADRRKDIKLQTFVTFFIGLSVILAAIMYIMTMTVKLSGSLIYLFLFVGICVSMGAIGPILNSLAFAFEKFGIKINYGLARGIGSAAYAVMSLGVGYLVDAMGTMVLPIAYSVFNIALILIVRSFDVPAADEEAKEETKEEQLSFFAFMAKYKTFMLFIGASVFVFFAHTIINNFYIKVITPIGGTSANMGTAIFIAAILELPAMTALDKIKDKISIKKLLVFSAIMFAIKHTVTWFAPNVFWIYFAAVLQVGAYALFYPAQVYFVNQVVDSKDLVKGQSLIAVAYTATGIFANIVGGNLIDIIGVKNVLFIGVVTSWLGAVFVFMAVNVIKTKNQ